jgi:hypothetical protein
VNTARKPTRHSDNSYCIFHLLNLLDFCAACGFTLLSLGTPRW